MAFGRWLIFLVFVVRASQGQQIAVSELNITSVDASNISGVYITLSLAPDPSTTGSNAWWSPLHIWVLVFAVAQILNWTWRYRWNLLSVIQGAPRYILRLVSRKGVHLNDEEAGITMQYRRLEDSIPLSQTHSHSSTTSRTQYSKSSTGNRSYTLSADLQKDRLGAPGSAPGRNITIPCRRALPGPSRNPRRSHARRYRYKPYPGGDLGVKSTLDDDTISAIGDAVEDAWSAGFGIGG